MDAEDPRCAGRSVRGRHRDAQKGKDEDGFGIRDSGFRPSMLFLRALIAFLALPGVVAFFAPALLVSRLTTRTVNIIGVVPFIAGVVVLLSCVRDFYVAGKGTLAPWDPPRHLVRVGLYRFSRNPMYVGVLLILIGWTALFRARALLIYTIVVAILFHLRVLLYEEPWLARTFPGEWPGYKARVPRWLFRMR
jgi:protein-S-isoprenylcysteine O-methyltransferase Ste14